LIYTCRIGRRGAKIRGKPEFLQLPEGFKTVFCLSNSLTLNIFDKKVNTRAFHFFIYKIPRYLFKGNCYLPTAGPKNPVMFSFVIFLKVTSQGKILHITAFVLSETGIKMPQSKKL